MSVLRIAVSHDTSIAQQLRSQDEGTLELVSQRLRALHALGARCACVAHEQIAARCDRSVV